MIRHLEVGKKYSLISESLRVFNEENLFNYKSFMILKNKDHNLECHILGEVSDSSIIWFKCNVRDISNNEDYGILYISKADLEKTDFLGKAKEFFMEALN